MDKPPAKLSGANAKRASEANAQLLKAVEGAHATLDGKPASSLHDSAAKATGLIDVALMGAPAGARIPDSGGADAERVLLSAKASVEPYWPDLAENVSSTISSLRDSSGTDPSLLAVKASDACRRADRTFRISFPPSSDPKGNVALLEKRAASLQRSLASIERLQAPSAKRGDLNRFKSLLATRVKLSYADAATYQAATVATSPEAYDEDNSRNLQVESTLDDNEKSFLIYSDKLGFDGCGFL